MIVAAAVELAFGIKAENKSLEEIAAPISSSSPDGATKDLSPRSSGYHA
jgi:hypothetical protein